MANTRSGLMILIALAACAAPIPGQPAAAAISAELAKKCRGLAIKAHPTEPAGKKAGSVQAQRDYFRDCVAKGGNMPDEKR
jgi:hypothetical protein